MKPDQLESEAYLAKDKQKREFIEYLLLQKVEYPTQGLTVDYTYSTYNPEPANPFERGVIRLYQDNQAISYYTYHPVTSVRFSYDQTSSLFGETERKSFIYYYKFTNQGKPTKEIWKTPKSGITRLSNHPLRQGDVVTIEETNSFSSQSTERTYRVNENEHFNLVLEKKTSPKEQSEQIVAEGKNYRYNPVSYTSYAYEGSKTKPSYVYHFVDNLPDGEAKKYLLAPQIDKRDKIENLSSLANETIYEYDQNGDITEQKDPNGLTTNFTYKEVGTLRLPVLMEQVAGDGHAKKQEYVYNRDNLLETKTLTAKYPGQEYEDKLLRTYKYGDKKLPISITEVQFGASDEFSHFSKTFIYDKNDLHVSTEQITVYNGENSLETYSFTYGYDDLDFVVTKQFPDKSIVGYFYDELGRIQKEMFISAEGDNRETTYSYTNHERKVMKTLPNKTGLITAYTPAGEVVFSVEVDRQGNRRTLVENSYAEDGKQLLATYPYGKKDRGTTYSYHSDGTLRAVTDALKRTTTMQYANQDQGSSLITPVEKTIAPNGLETTQLYDRYGQLITSMVHTTDGTLSTETQMQYDRFGNPTHKQITNEQGEKHSWDYKHDLRGEPIYVKDPEKNVYKFQYDANGNLMSTFENDKETARYVYNGLSWKLREIDPATEKVKENYEYDKSGNLASFTDQKGNTRKYTYTPFYELDTMQVLSGKKVVETEKNTYDQTTRQLLTQQNNDTKVSYTYDGFLRPTSMTTFGRTYEQRYEDEDDTPDSIVYPDGTITAYTYDELGRILSVKHPGMGKVTYEYDTSPTGDTVHVQYPNGTKIEKGFNAFGQTTDVQHFQANNKAWEEQNQYNGFGNLVETTVNQSASTFGYDKLDRIRKETTPTREQTYTYDERGNRQSILTAKSPTITDSSYTYDALNRLKTYSKNGKESTYTYYPGELRASKEIDGKTTHYVYLNGNVIEELDDKNNLQARNIWGNELLYRDDVKGEKQGYYYTNAHGDIVEIKDKAGQTLNKYEYDLWGNVEIKQEKMSNPFLYAGELYDEESGLIYLRARYYDPNDGRFITEDTYKGQVDNPLSLNRYTYVYNNPLIHSDPTGNVAFPVSPSLTCAVDMANCKTNLDAQVTAGKKIATEGANFLIVDDINTLLDPTKSVGEKAYTAASLFPFAKVLKAAKVEVKINKAAKAISKCNCFTEGTKVLTDEGEKPIEEIEVGDKVLAKSDETGEVAYKEVTATFNHETDEIYKIHVGDQVIESTFNHPFWVDSKGWTFVKDLKVGDLLVKSDGDTLKIDSIELEHKQVTVYNMTVDELHTYFVSDLGIWVHNSNCNFSVWNKGSFDAVEGSAEYHFKKHGKEVGAGDLAQYLRKAEEFAKTAKKGSTKSYVNGAVEGTVRYKKNGKYIDIAPDGTIVSFGKQ